MFQLPQIIVFFILAIATVSLGCSKSAEEQYDLGVKYDNGVGVPEDDQEALRWYRLAADQGYAQAQVAVGAYYFLGEILPEDFQEGVRLFRLAANQGSLEGQLALAWLYQEGMGVPQDLVYAYAWFNIAGSAPSEYALEEKNKVAQSLTKAQISEGQELSREIFRKIEATVSK